MASPLRYPVASPPAAGEAIPLEGGVHWVRLPLPGSLRHINVWLLEDGAGWTLIDTGMDLPEVRAAWRGPLARYLGGRPITRIICTHHHPDHVGLAAWLAATHGAPVYMSRAEARLLGCFAGRPDESSGAHRRVEAFARDGLIATDRSRATIAGESFRRVVSGVPSDLRLLEAGTELSIGGERWVALDAKGHTDGQLLFHAPQRRLLISGDQVLPRITSNIGIYPERADRAPLASFLASFAALAALDPEPLVLPSHGDVFVGLRARLLDLAAHHGATLEQVLSLVEGPVTARELADRLFRSPLDSMNLVLAVGEALAHLEHLAATGALRALEPPGGPRRYERVPAALPTGTV